MVSLNDSVYKTHASRTLQINALKEHINRLQIDIASGAQIGYHFDMLTKTLARKVRELQELENS